MPLTDEDTARKFFDFVEALNDDDDVQRVSANYDISDELLAKLED
jgi:transcriptional/translational regulatory protein YebC/TACO1